MWLGWGFNRPPIYSNEQVGRSVEETIRLIQAFQFVAKHGEVCPAGWKPGTSSNGSIWIRTNRPATRI